MLYLCTLSPSSCSFLRYSIRSIFQIFMMILNNLTRKYYLMTIILNPEPINWANNFLVHYLLFLSFTLPVILKGCEIAVFRLLPVSCPCCTTGGSTVLFIGPQERVKAVGRLVSYVLFPSHDGSLISLFIVVETLIKCYAFIFLSQQCISIGILCPCPLMT